MKLIHGISRGLKNINDIIVGSILSLAIPKYGKRMIFIVSLFTALGGKHAKDHEILSRLNKLMHLCKDDRALDFSALVATKALNAKELDDLITEVCQGRGVKDGVRIDEVRVIAQRIMTKTPKWLRYDSEEIMVYDTERTVLSAGKIPTNA